MAEASRPRASRYVFRLRGRFGSGHQGVPRVRRALQARRSQSPLADIHGPSSHVCKAFALKLVGAALLERRDIKRLDSVGTLHFSHWVPFENNHIGFFTIFDGDFAKYIQDFADKTTFVFDTLFPHVIGAPPTPVAKNAQAFISVGIGKQLSAHRVLQRLSRPLGSRHSKPCWPIASHNRPPLESRRGTTINQELRLAAERHKEKHDMSQSHLVD